MSKHTAMKKTRHAGIYRRPNGKYLVRIRGNGYSLSETFTALDVARAWQRNTLADLEAGRSVIVNGKVVDAAEAERAAKAADGRTLSDLIDRFEKTGECRIAAAHLNQYRDALGDRLVDEITRADVSDLLDQQTAGRAPATFNRYRAGVHRLMNYAVEKDWRTDNPVTGIKRKREDNRRDHVIDTEEQGALQTACDAHDRRLGLFFALSMAVGSRVGELQGLTWRDVDLNRGTLRLGAGSTKNRDARTLVVRGNALDRLKAFAKVQPLNKDELVFQADRGGVFDATKMFRLVANSTGRPDVILHNCRHTFATRLARVPGVTLVMLRDALGHKSLAMVQRYSHEMTDDLADKLALMMESQS